MKNLLIILFFVSIGMNAIAQMNTKVKYSYEEDLKEKETPGYYLKGAGNDFINAFICGSLGAATIALTADQPDNVRQIGFIGGSALLVGAILNNLTGAIKLRKAGLKTIEMEKRSVQSAIYIEPAKTGIGLCMRF